MQLLQDVNRIVLPLLGLVIVLLCLPQLLRRRKEAPTGAFLINALNRDRLPLPRCENSIGRARGCDVCLNYGSVSRYHAVIALRREGWVLMDTGSQLGTKCDGLPVQGRAALGHGQRLTFGSFDFFFCTREEDARI